MTQFVCRTIILVLSSVQDGLLMSIDLHASQIDHCATSCLLLSPDRRKPSNTKDVHIVVSAIVNREEKHAAEKYTVRYKIVVPQE